MKKTKKQTKQKQKQKKGVENFDQIMLTVTLSARLL